LRVLQLLQGGLELVQVHRHHLVHWLLFLLLSRVISQSLKNRLLVIVGVPGGENDHLRFLVYHGLVQVTPLLILILPHYLNLLVLAILPVVDVMQEFHEAAIVLLVDALLRRP